MLTALKRAQMEFYFLNSEDTDPKRLKREREKARELRKSSWWNQKIQQGRCHYCNGQFDSKNLTMDHVVPLARGGSSSKGNLVPSCLKCNQEKKLQTPADRILSATRK